jgi:hypothetical protein
MEMIRRMLVFIPAWTIWGWSMLLQTIRRQVLRRASGAWSLVVIEWTIRLHPGREALERLYVWADR